MTQQIDRETELVALMAASFVGEGWSPAHRAELALQILEVAIEKVEERRGVERSYEALEAAAHKVVEKNADGGYRIIVEDWNLEALERLDAALKATDGE